MADYYVDAYAGDDEDTGASWDHAKKTIQGAFDLITDVIAETTTIHLQTDPTNNSNIYSNDCILRGVNAVGKNSILYIQPKDWSESDYQGGKNPFDSASQDLLDIKGDKPVQLNLKMTILDSDSVVLRGLGFGESEEEDVSLQVEGHSRVILEYCRFEGAETPLYFMGPVMARVEMSYLKDAHLALTATGGASVSLSGDNLIEDSLLAGINLTNRASVTVNRWPYNPTAYFTTTIQTSVGHKEEYRAIWLRDAAVFSVTTDPLIPIDVFNGKVVVNHDDSKLPEKYYGVKLASQSLLSGADNFQFTMKNLKGETIEMPVEQQVIVGEGQNATVAD